jgi:hypothetical protein
MQFDRFLTVFFVSLFVELVSAEWSIKVDLPLSSWFPAAATTQEEIIRQFASLN